MNSERIKKDFFSTCECSNMNYVIGCLQFSESAWCSSCARYRSISRLASLNSNSQRQFSDSLRWNWLRSWGGWVGSLVSWSYWCRIIDDRCLSVLQKWEIPTGDDLAPHFLSFPAWYISWWSEVPVTIVLYIYFIVSAAMLRRNCGGIGLLEPITCCEMNGFFMSSLPFVYFVRRFLWFLGRYFKRQNHLTFFIWISS